MNVSARATTGRQLGGFLSFWALQSALLLAAAPVAQGRALLAQVPAAGGSAAPRVRPQDPLPPLPYRFEDVRYRNAAAGIELAGTLTLPSGGGPFPAVVLISGSGPQNRDAETYGHRTFLVLADHLTRQGVAVLRSDDRGVGATRCIRNGCPGGVFEQATTEDFAADAAAAAAYLRSRPEIRREAVGLIGHSEGGLVATMVANGSDPVAFLVLMGSPALHGEQILYQQSALVARTMGASDAQLEYNRQLQEQVFAVIKAEADQPTRLRRMEEVLRAQVAALSEAERAASGLTREGEDEWVRSQQRAMGGPWFRFFLLYDPLPALRRVRVPVLALGGSRDLQVPPEPNLTLIDNALREVGAPGSLVVRTDLTNHLFQRATTGLPAEYWDIPETMDREVLTTISSWILQRVQR